jgi:hypothetical protein
VDAPPAFLLRIRGHDFGLGEALGERAAANLKPAARLAAEFCLAADPEHWRNHADNRVASE